jgi:hypothetical protein
MRLTPIAYNIIIVVMATIILGLLLWLILYYRHQRRQRTKAQGDEEQQRPRLSRSIVIMAGMGLVSLAFIGVIVAVGTAGDGHQTLALPLLLITGIVVFLGALASLVVIFRRQGLANRDFPLGLPDGSIRAIIALSLILLFAIVAIFLYIGQGGFGTDNQPTDAQTDMAKQLVTTLSTLVVAIASFYFGSTTVEKAHRSPEAKGTPPSPTEENPLAEGEEPPPTPQAGATGSSGTAG